MVLIRQRVGIALLLVLGVKPGRTTTSLALMLHFSPARSVL